MTTGMFRRTAVAALAIAALAACNQNNDADTAVATTDSATAATPAPPPETQMNDGNILAAIIAADSTEVMAGGMIKSLATDAGLRQFATMLVTDHGKNAADAAALAQKDSITVAPLPGDTSARHMQHVKTMLEGMQKSTATDSAIVQNMIDGHQATLDQLTAAESKAQNPDVKGFIGDTKAAVQKHLDAAKALKDRIRK